MDTLKNVRVAIIATDGFEEAELIEPLRALKDSGADVEVLSPKAGSIQGFKHFDKSKTVKVDRELHQARPEDYDAIVLPGGALNADQARMDRSVQQFIRTFDQAGKPLAMICHAPWELISANVVRGRRLTSYHTIQDDVRNAGGNWVDQEVVVDRNWVTSRQPSDLPAFNREMVKLFATAGAGVHR